MSSGARGPRPRWRSALTFRVSRLSLHLCLPGLLLISPEANPNCAGKGTSVTSFQLSQVDGEHNLPSRPRGAQLASTFYSPPCTHFNCTWDFNCFNLQMPGVTLTSVHQHLFFPSETVMAGHRTAWTDYMSQPPLQLDLAVSLITAHVTVRAAVVPLDTSCALLHVFFPLPAAAQTRRRSATSMQEQSSRVERFRRRGGLEKPHFKHVFSSGVLSEHIGHLGCR